MSYRIQFEGACDLNLAQTFDCGQCFRWRPEEDGSWSGIAGEHIAKASYDASSQLLVIEDSQPDEDFWFNYFDLGRDYGAIKKLLSEGDPVMEKAASLGSGIRILNQDRWETLVSFIISQNNNIPRIRKCIESLAKALGNELADGIYALPTPAALASATLDDLVECRLGYRAGYLIEAGKFMSSEGPAFLEELASPDMSGAEAIKKLTQIHGVGPKVASCVALFCLGKIDSFPLDVWMKRVMNQLYGIPEKDTKAMEAFAREHFGQYGGIAQQYLFNYITHFSIDK